MAARRKLTTFSKFILTMVIVGGLAYGFIYLRDNGYLASLGIESEGTDGPKKKKKKGGSSDENTINIGVVTWGGYAAGQYFNEGFEASEESRFYKDYGFKVNFMILDNPVTSRKAFENNEVDLLWATIDAFPTESGQLAGDPQVVFQADWSRGGDAIVARRGINSVADLKGKKIAVAEMSPSHTFLLWLLEAGDLKSSDVEIEKVESAVDAAAAFKSKSVDAAVVWSPDDEDCINSVSGAKILQNTRNASNIIADVFIAKKDYIDENKEKLAQLYEGWMIGAAELNSSDANKRKAAKILAKNFSGFDEDMTYQAINNVRLCTHGDNENFFGLNRDYQGVTGEDLYLKMSEKYAELGYITETPPSWRFISRPDAAVEGASFSGAEQEAEGQKKFVKVDEDEGKKKKAVATKRLSITFPSGSATLGDNAKNLIDYTFVDIAKAFSNSRIRIEGNTDAVGSRTTNIALSKKRAQAVADYLIKEHGMPAERFIIIGNGPDNPVEGCENSTSADCNSKNRRTDFELVSDE